MTLSELYTANRRSLVFKTFPYTRSYDVSEDLLQEAFLKALDKFSQYDSKKGPLKGWFTKILFSVLWDYMRAQRRIPPMFDIDSIQDSDLLSYEPVTDLREYLGEIKHPKHRQVLLAYMVVGNNAKEIASVLKVKEDNVRKIVERFRKAEK